ncbi:MAG TPA: aspartate kinase [Candidatus Deferrimicrobium sp.]|nr:aspartate kinase [Candidatus Deferrimicrobium sp.]
MQQIVVMQFGVSCLRNATTFQKITEVLQKYQESNLVLVVSALPGIVDLLDDCADKADACTSYVQDLILIRRQHLELIEEILEEPYKTNTQNFLDDKFTQLEDILEDIEEYGVSDSKLDIVLSFGEIISGYIMNQFLLSKQIESEYLLGDKFLITDSKYNNALPIMNVTVRKIRTLLLPLLKLDQLPVVTGFIGRNREGHLTTLGVGGTEFTASLIAYCLKDEQNEIKVILWKDVNGILTADPRIVPSARTIKQISYAEAKEIAIGTEFIHPKCIRPIQNRGIPLEIRNINDITGSNYTTIQKDSINSDKIIGITYQEEVTMVSAISESTVEIPGVLAKIFDLMGQNNINITMVSQGASEINTTFVVDAVDGDIAKELLSESEFFKEWFDIRVADVSMISVVGEGINNPKNLEKMFNAFHTSNIKTLALSQASDGLNITVLVKKEDLSKALQTLHHEFELDKLES